MTNKELYLWLNSIYSIGPVTMNKLITYTDGDLQALFKLSDRDYEELIEYKVLNRRQAHDLSFNSSVDKASKVISDLLKKLEDKKCNFFTIEDEIYPEELMEIYDPPPILFYRGRIDILSNTNRCSIVGARVPSIYGTEMTGYFSKSLSESGIVIVSGLANGVDVTSHIAAINSNGSTIGVLGCGIDICYPQDNFLTYDEMSKNQLILSEYGVGVTPKAYYFPMRNRIISGLSKVLLVIEARKKSGSLITADQALEQGKAVFALPGRITDSLNEGTNNLIKQGAAIALCPDDIISEFFGVKPEDEFSLYDSFSAKISNMGLSENEIAIINLLGIDPVDTEFLLRKTGISTTELLNILINLERKSLIKQPFKGFYIKSF